MDDFRYVRGARPVDLPAIRTNLELAFGANPNDREAAHTDRWIDRAGLDNFRVVLRKGSSGDESLAASLWVIPMGHYFGGRSVSAVGVAGVATPVEARRRGAAKRLMAEVVRECAREGFGVSSLYPALLPLYRGAGYELAGGAFTYSVPLHVCRRVQSERRVEPLGARGELPSDEVQACYDRCAVHENGALDRGPLMWRRVAEPRNYYATGFGVRDDQGVLRGYFYMVRLQAGERSDLFVSDLRAEDDESARALLAALGEMESTASQVRWFGGPFDPIVLALRDPRYDIRLKDYWMLRIANVGMAFGERGYPAGVRAELHFEFFDELVPANAGRYVLTVENGRGHLEPGGDGTLALHVRDAAPIFTSFLSPTMAARHGRIRGDAETLALADTVFSGPAPGLADHF